MLQQLGVSEMNFATLGSFEVFFMHLTSLGLDAPFFIPDSSGVIDEESKKCFNEKEEIPLPYCCKGIKS